MSPWQDVVHCGSSRLVHLLSGTAVWTTLYYKWYPQRPVSGITKTERCLSRMNYWKINTKATPVVMLARTTQVLTAWSVLTRNWSKIQHIQKEWSIDIISQWQDDWKLVLVTNFSLENPQLQSSRLAIRIWSSTLLDNTSGQTNVSA